MRNVALVLSLAIASGSASSSQDTPKELTVVQLDQLLATDHSKSDATIADQLSGVSLTERASTQRLAHWQNEFPGPRTRESLTVLADASSFLPAPASDQIALPTPDLKAQGALMGKAIDYASQTLPKLPNFLATRSTTQIEDVADIAHDGGSLARLNTLHAGSNLSAGNAILHVARRFSVRVAYRDGKEVTEAPAKGKKLQVANTGLTTSGEFGPILGLVISDAIRSSIHWSHWEQGPTAAEAVFAYKVQQAKSHYQVAFPFGKDLVQLTPAYHGEIAIDPTTGSVLRLTVIADLGADYTQVEAAILVEFGPVDIGLHSYICPVKAIALSRLPIANTVDEAKKPDTPRRTEINDVAFTDYHVFRSTAHILTEDEVREREQESPTATATATTTTPEPIAPVQPTAPEPPAPTETAVAPPPPPAPIVTSIKPPTAPLPTPAVADVPPPAAFPKTAVLHASANLILLDVVVTDHNKPVQGLDQKRFHIFDNGKEHPITTFTEHAATPTAAPAAPTTLPPHTYSNTPTHPEGAAATVLLIDGLNTPKINVEDVRRAMIQYMEKVPPGTEVAIFTLSSQLHMIQGFTTNTAPLLEALRKFQIGAHPGDKLTNDSETNSSSTAADMAATGSIPPAMVATYIRWMQQAADLKTQETDQRVHLTVDGLQQLARYLSAVPGRKNLLWFSGSFPLGLGPTDDVPLSAQADPLKDMRNYENEVRTTSDLLATARVAVYPVDARGVVESTAYSVNPSSAPSVTFAPGGGQVAAHAIPTAPINFEHKNMAEADTMTEVADETGGRTFHTNDLGAAVQEVVANSSSYYTIGYVPTGKLNGSFRNFKVTIDGVHYTLSYRKGYFADDPEHPSDASKLISRAHSPLLTATLPGAPPATQILFQARVLPVTDPLFTGKHLEDGAAGQMSATLKGPLKRYIADITVDPSTLTFTTLPDSKQRVQIDFALVGYNADSSRVNDNERSLQLDYTAQQFADIMANGLRVRLALDMPSAPGSLRIAIFDPATIHTGALEVAIPPTSH